MNIFHTLILTIHILVCICLVIAVLLQSGKGADIGAVFGGAGSQALFGSSGPVDFLNKATRFLVVVFMLTSLTLAYFTPEAPSKSIMTSSPVAGKVAPGGAAAPKAPGAPPVSTPQQGPTGPVIPVQPAQVPLPAVPGK